MAVKYVTAPKRHNITDTLLSARRPMHLSTHAIILSYNVDFQFNSVNLFSPEYGRLQFTSNPYRIIHGMTMRVQLL